MATGSVQSAAVETDTIVPGITCVKRGNIVTIRCSRSGGFDTDGVIIPSGYRPGYGLLFTGKANRNGSDVWNQGFGIDADGKLTARSVDNNSAIVVTWVSFSVTFVQS
jgi:hypothetical protein